jgi:hypothetical protein
MKVRRINFKTRLSVIRFTILDKTLTTADPVQTKQGQDCHPERA